VTKVRLHLENAMSYLSLDDDLDRLVSPRHTDKEALVYLPRRVAKDIANARREIKAALDELSEDAP
jgi:hypothetical protein